MITVLDRARFEAAPCAGYDAVRRETDLLLAYLPQRQVIRNNDSIPKVILPLADAPATLDVGQAADTR
jgi:hypothetical protein